MELRDIESELLLVENKKLQKRILDLEHNEEVLRLRVEESKLRLKELWYSAHNLLEETETASAQIIAPNFSKK